MGTNAQAALHVAPDVPAGNLDADAGGLAPVIDELRGLLAVQQAAHADLAGRLAVVKAREAQLSKALAALTGEAPAPAASAKPKSPPGGDWIPGEEKIAAVLAAIIEAGEPVTATVLVGIVHMAGETVRRALDELRARNQIRLVGTTRGGGRLFAAMPGAAVAAIQPPATPPAAERTWSAAPESVDAVVAALATFDEPRSSVAIGQAAGLSRDTARRALEVAVGEGRAAGVEGRTPQNVKVRLYVSAPAAAAS